MRLGELRGRELIDRAAAVHLGVVYHVDAALDEETGRLIDLHLLARRGWFGARQIIPWQTIEKVGKELIIVNLELSEAIMHAGAEDVWPDRAATPIALPWPRQDLRRRRRFGR